jgi:hypothetical protein
MYMINFHSIIFFFIITKVNSKDLTFAMVSLMP